MFAPETSNPRSNGSSVGADDLAAAIGEDCPGDAFHLAPRELCVDSGVPDDGLPSRSQQWANDARSIAYVEHDAAQRRLLVENCRYVRRIEQHRVSDREAIAHRRSTDGVLQRECLPGDGTEMEELPCFDGVRWAIG